MKKNQFGIMQGRLFPESYKIYNQFPTKWNKEFFEGKKIGYNYLELIYDEGQSKKNPINNLDHKSIISVKKKSGLKTYSMVLNFFAKNDLFSDTKKFINTLKILVTFAKKTNIRLIIIPVIEKSSANFNKLDIIIKKIHKDFKNEKIKFSFELDSNINLVNKKKLFLKYSPKIGICYDTGNSISELNSFKKEIFYLRKEINHLHLKDKKKIGKNFVNTFLGNGLLDFKSLKEVLNTINYKYKITLECFYEKNAIKEGKKNIEYAFMKLL